MYAFVEHRNITDREQEGFRKFHGSSMKLLHPEQEMVNGFNAGKTSVGVFIDLEKAYDSVWRNGLLVKMFDIGVQSKIWS